MGRERTVLVLRVLHGDRWGMPRARGDRPRTRMHARVRRLLPRMRPRYYKQRDQFRCGPIAIYNALKWEGGFKGLTAKKAMPRLDALCDCDRITLGTYHGPFESTLRRTARDFYDVRRVYTPKLHEIEEHLRAGGAIILNYQHIRKGEVARHYVLVTDMSPGGEYFGVVNYQPKRPVYQRIHRDTLKKHIMRFRQPPFKGWFLTRTSQ